MFDFPFRTPKQEFDDLNHVWDYCNFCQPLPVFVCFTCRQRYSHEQRAHAELCCCPDFTEETGESLQPYEFMFERQIVSRQGQVLLALREPILREEAQPVSPAPQALIVSTVP